MIAGGFALEKNNVAHLATWTRPQGPRGEITRFPHVYGYVVLIVTELRHVQEVCDNIMYDRTGKLISSRHLNWKKVEHGHSGNHLNKSCGKILVVPGNLISSRHLFTSNTTLAPNKTVRYPHWECICTSPWDKINQNRVHGAICSIIGIKQIIWSGQGFC